MIQVPPGQEVRELLADRECPLEIILGDDRGRQGGDDAYHRPDLDRHGLAAGRLEPVVVQPVGIVPQPQAVQRLGDRGEVLEELQDEILGGPSAGSIQGYGHGAHRDCVEAHPAGGVGLLKDIAGRQVRAVDRADVV